MTERQIYAAVQEIAGRHVPDNIKITPFDTLVDLGMDSLDSSRSPSRPRKNSECPSTRTRAAASPSARP